MKRLLIISYKYRLAMANLMANLIGVVVINQMIFRDFALPDPEVLEVTRPGIT
jgi:hypothetical protein